MHHAIMYNNSRVRTHVHTHTQHKHKETYTPFFFYIAESEYCILYVITKQSLIVQLPKEWYTRLRYVNAVDNATNVMNLVHYSQQRATTVTVFLEPLRLQRSPCPSSGLGNHELY